MLYPLSYGDESPAYDGILQATWEASWHPYIASYIVPTHELHLRAPAARLQNVATGWSMRDDLTAPLVVDALQMATTRRRPGPGCIAHSDRGAEVHLGDLRLGTCRPRPCGIDGKARMRV